LHAADPVKRHCSPQPYLCLPWQGAVNAAFMASFIAAYVQEWSFGPICTLTGRNAQLNSCFNRR
jgi:hypothetical protein